MQVIHPEQFAGERAWDALDIEAFDRATVRLHWTDAPYRWHVNDGAEVFVVLDGMVEMRTRDAHGERTWQLGVGDIFHATTGDEHVAHPRGPARVLVIEREGSE